MSDSKKYNFNLPKFAMKNHFIEMNRIFLDGNSGKIGR